MKNILKGAAAITLSAVLSISLMGTAFAIEEDSAQKSVEITVQDFEESNKELRNPGRGFYQIHPFVISDEPMEEEYKDLVSMYQSWNPDLTLALVEVNLQNYRDGDITQVGLDNIDALLNAWAEKTDRQMILRFFYFGDENDPNLEPDNLDIVLRHMEQIGPILSKYESSIYTLQGLFIGQWGEMHGTHFLDSASADDNVCRLAETLSSVTPDGMFLSVRTPALWDMATAGEAEMENRIGLFNDGMFGSETDIGTYWGRDRSDMIAFQENQCTLVPNGGEVSNDSSTYPDVNQNPYSDFENVVCDMASMHISYLNQDWMRAVLDKWSNATVSGDGCFDGLDGLTYIERHLGYRLLINEASISQPTENDFEVSVDFKNVGFASLYKSPSVMLYLEKDGSREVVSCEMNHELTNFSGGHDSQNVETAQVKIPVETLSSGTYRLYVDLQYDDSRTPILLANTQDREENGYYLGSVTLGGDDSFPSIEEIEPGIFGFSGSAIAGVFWGGMNIKKKKD